MEKVRALSCCVFFIMMCLGASCENDVGKILAHKEGESCLTTSECFEGLICKENKCTKILILDGDPEGFQEGDLNDRDGESASDADIEAMDNEHDLLADGESEVENDSDFIAVSSIYVGGNHTCALMTSGDVYCWGSNAYFQLGNDTPDMCIVQNKYYPCSMRPLLLFNLTDGEVVTSMALGEDHSCALFGNGKVKCWGRNNSGQLGDGTKLNRKIPTYVIGLPGKIKNLTARGEHTCALTEENSVYCWGNNQYGQLGEVSQEICFGGDNSNYSCSTRPIAARNMENDVLSISAGINHTCALSSNGKVKCWGYNALANLGNGNTTNSTAPVEIGNFGNGVDSITAISAAGSHTCALTKAGRVYCWGSVLSGSDCGIGTGCCGTSACFLIPTQINSLFFPESSEVSLFISLGRDHACAMQTTGDVACWGNDEFGQLGSGPYTNCSPMVDPYCYDRVFTAEGLRGVIALVSGADHTCALTNTKKLMCWGRDDFGQLGVNTATKCFSGLCCQTPVFVNW